MTLVKVNNPINRSIDGLWNELFNELPLTFGKALREDVLHFPPANILEKKDHYRIEMAVPGMDKSDFNVKLEDKLLTISADKKTENVSETDKVVRKEFSQKSFKRSFTIDDKIDTAAISAKYENGILVLELPKKEDVKNGSKEITIQ